VEAVFGEQVVEVVSGDAAGMLGNWRRNLVATAVGERFEAGVISARRPPSAM